MRNMIVGIIIGLCLAAAPALAFHYFGHDPGEDAMERMQQQQERFLQEQFRQQQWLDQQQRRGPC